MSLTKELLKSSSFWVLNKSLVGILGIETAFLLTNLVEAEELMGDKDGWVYQTIETLESMTGLSRYQQNVSIKKLKELGMIQQQNRDIPRKRYFKINYNAISESICKKLDFCSVNNCTSVEQKTDNNKERTHKEHINKQPPKPKPKSSVDSLIENYTLNPLLKESLNEFVKMRVAKKKKPTEYAMKQILNRLDRFAKTDEQKIEIVDRSTRNSWIDIYEVGNKNDKSQNGMNRF